MFPCLDCDGGGVVVWACAGAETCHLFLSPRARECPGTRGTSWKGLLRREHTGVRKTYKPRAKLASDSSIFCLFRKRFLYLTWLSSLLEWVKSWITVA